MKTYVIENKDNERFEVEENDLTAFLKQKNLRWSRLKNTWDGWERNDPRRFERGYKISEVLGVLNQEETDDMIETVDVIGKTERKPKYTTTETGYLVQYGENKSVHITEEELSKFRKLYCGKHSMTIEQVGLEFNMVREEVYAIKSAFSIVKQSIPFTEKEVDTLSVDEMAEISRIEKKKAYFRKLEDLKVEDMERELKKLHQKDYYLNKLIDKMGDIKVRDIEVKQTKIKPITLIVSLSDMHVGAKCDNVVNKYDISIFRERMKAFTDNVIREILFYEPEKVIVQNIGDTINGIKNVANRIEAECGLIDSVIVAVEEIATMLKEIAKYSYVEYYNVFANHSEIYKDKILNIEEENMERFVTWGLKNIFDQSRVYIHDAEDVISYSLYGEIVSLHHGHNNLSVDKITSKTKRVPKAIYQGHLHNLSIKTLGMTEIIQIGTMMGTDSYALAKGFLGEPSQLITVVESDWNRRYIPIYFK